MIPTNEIPKAFCDRINRLGDLTSQSRPFRSGKFVKIQRFEAHHCVYSINENLMKIGNRPKAKHAMEFAALIPPTYSTIMYFET